MDATLACSSLIFTVNMLASGWVRALFLPVCLRLSAGAIQPVVSPGWVILGCTLILWGSYVTLGMAWMMLKHGRFDYAHRDEWKLWLDDVKLGAKFLTSQLPCQRKYEHIQ
jgi:hypothetical protein